MNPALATAAPDIRDRYRNQVRAASQSVDARTRAFAALDNLRALREAWNRTSVVVRIIVLHDALALLAPPGALNSASDLQRHGRFADMGPLRNGTAQLRQSQGESHPADASIEAVSLLDQLIDRASQDTYQSYVAFAQAQAGFNARADDATTDDLALQRYDAWLKRYRTYLVLDLPLLDEDQHGATEQAIDQRMEFFLAKNPVEDVRARFEDRLWTYIYDVRYCMQAKDFAEV